MAIVPSVTAQIDEKEIFKVISNNFSKLAPAYYFLISNWLIRAYNVHKDIDKYIIIIYLINRDLIVFRRNGLIVNYETFYRDRSIEIEKINLSEISKDLEIPKEIVNVNGGAIALGHPIGASGTRIIVTLIHEMIRRNAKKGLGTLCRGGGMGIAMCIERD